MKIILNSNLIPVFTVQFSDGKKTCFKHPDNYIGIYGDLKGNTLRNAYFADWNASLPDPPIYINTKIDHIIMTNSHRKIFLEAESQIDSVIKLLQYLNQNHITIE